VPGRSINGKNRRIMSAFSEDDVSLIFGKTFEKLVYKFSMEGNLL